MVQTMGSALSYWWPTLGDEKPKTPFEVVASGTLFRADPKPLVAETYCLEEWRDRASTYWSGATGSEPLEEELLFEGTLEVIAKYDTLEEFEQRVSGDDVPESSL